MALLIWCALYMAIGANTHALPHLVPNEMTGILGVYYRIEHCARCIRQCTEKVRNGSTTVKFSPMYLTMLAFFGDGR